MRRARSSSGGRKPKTRNKRPTREDTRAMAKQRKPDRTPQPIAPEADPMYEPKDSTAHLDTASVIVDLEEARTPRSETAKNVAAQAKGAEQIEAIRTRRAGSATVFEINPYDLHLEVGWNVRNFDTPNRRAEIAKLAQSITEVGVREALLAHIKDGRILVHSGWNRLLATYHAIEHGAPIMAVPVRFGRASEDDADRTLSQIVNNGVRSDLTPYEKGKVIKRMVNYGWQIPAIARAVGVSVTNVNALLEMQALPPAIQGLVANGTLGGYLALEQYRDAGKNEARAMELIQYAMNKAQESGSDHVTRQHTKAAAPRLPRGSKRHAAETRRPAAEPATENIPHIITILRNAKYERDPAANTATMAFHIDDFTELAVLADLPEENEITLGEIHNEELIMDEDDEPDERETAPDEFTRDVSDE